MCLINHDIVHMGQRQDDLDLVIKSSLENNGARNREGEQASEI